jgi:hypothetical protein
MESKNQSNKKAADARKPRKHHPLYKALFLDVLFDKSTRPIFIYAISMVFVGSALFHYLEGWDWLDSLYFVVITLTTIGYGDFSPTTPVTKLITIIYGLNGIILLLMLFDAVRTLRGWEIRPRSTNTGE